jgi:hypothetical protein
VVAQPYLALAALLVPSGRLEEADDVAVRVLHAGDQLAPTDVPDLLVRLRARLEERLQTLRDVVNVPAADRPRHPLAVAVGIQTDILTLNAEADVVRGAPRVVRGAAAVADTFSGRARFARPALVNGAAGLVWAPGGRPRVVFGFTITHAKIVEIDPVADPARLSQLDLALLEE